jgi:large subunit ribosomal protein L15
LLQVGKPAVYQGQHSRAGFGGHLYRQGGNLPFYRRLPFMRGEGFTPVNRVEYNVINVGKLNDFKAGTELTPDFFAEKGMLHQKRNPVAILGSGDLKIALTVKAHRFSQSAKEKIDAAGGKAEIIDVNCGDSVMRTVYEAIRMAVSLDIC